MPAPSGPPRAEWRWKLHEQRGYAFLELGIIALIFLADQHHLIYLSKTPYLLALGWLSLRLRGLSWRAVGFSRPTSW